MPLEPESFDVGVINPSGWGNLGDAAIVDSVLHALKVRLPQARPALLTLRPADSAPRHGVQAFTCTGFTLRNYGVSVDAPWAGPDAASGAVEDGAVASTPRLGQRLGAWLRSMPGMDRMLGPARLVRGDLRHRRQLKPFQRSLRLVVIAGGGQLDDTWGGALGHPYVLLRWAHTARNLGARYLVLSVGTGSLRTPLARMFVRKALSLADYRSFRDAESRGLSGCPSCETDPVVPDLAYGLPMEGQRRRAPRASSRPVVGVSPIAYCDPRVWPEIDAARYGSYLRRLTELTLRLVESGHAVRLFATDGCDNDNIADVVNALDGRLSPEALSHVSTRRVDTTAELFALYAELDIAVVSRLHGGILAHLMDLPVVALSYERKVRTLMASMRHEHLCLDIDDFNVEAALQVCQQAVREREALSADVRAKVEAMAHRVQEQYDRVFAGC